MQARPIELGLTPREVLAAWPRAEPLAALLSGHGGPGERDARSRWSILARPASAVRLGVEGDGGGGGRGGKGALERLGELLRGTASASSEPGGPPFRAGWIGYVSYDLGREVEGRAQHPRPPRSLHPWPLMEWHRCPGAYAFDGAEEQWWIVGNEAGLPAPKELEAGRGRGAGPLRMEALTSLTGRAEFERQVARAVELIHAGDVFQVNLAHCLRGGFAGSARELFLELAASARPWYGAYLESGDEAILSLSPELFLEFDAGTRRVVTRPMKGTRAAAAGRASLLESEKDAAELNMIVDLMRNDLGRVCEYGTVRVEEGRVVERHGGGEDRAERQVAATTCRAADGERDGGVLQGVATVSGLAREGIGVPELLGAAFPPGSVTGAPKIRAMQIIDELEPVRRGPYCGAIGYISDHGHAALSVAIRTALLTRRAEEKWDLSYSVGAGIVADSIPAEEWRETLVKAGVVARLAGIKEGAG